MTLDPGTKVRPSAGDVATLARKLDALAKKDLGPYFEAYFWGTGLPK